jgi:RNA polymerase sigma factor (TIGR02999 family)
MHVRHRRSHVAPPGTILYTAAMEAASEDITLLLRDWREGAAGAEAALVNRIYPVLRQLAASRLRRSETMTWQPTDLVGEAYAKLFGQQADFQNRQHFFAIAARVMRRVVADHYRERHAQKRGDGVHVTSLLDGDRDAGGAGRDQADLVELDRLLDDLDAIDARGAEIVQLRYFAGLTVPEVATVLGISERTVKRSWHFARAWLHERLDEPARGGR